jgi:hypothetical protein
MLAAKLGIPAKLHLVPGVVPGSALIQCLMFRAGPAIPGAGCRGAAGGAPRVSGQPDPELLACSVLTLCGGRGEVWLPCMVSESQKGDLGKILLQLAAFRFLSRRLLLRPNHRIGGAAIQSTPENFPDGVICSKRLTIHRDSGALSRNYQRQRHRTTVLQAVWATVLHLVNRWV